jgi:1,4-dihydroxy-2-naphthoate octaprenyltransferase
MKKTKIVRIYLWTCFQMSRPAQLLLIAMVYIFGTIIALAVGSRFNWVPFLYGLLTLIPASASVHYANEYADYETDNLTVRTAFSGGSGALQVSGLSRQLALISAWAALFIGIILVSIGWAAGLLNGYAIVILALGTFSGWMYSLRPLAFARRGWGELVNALLGGVLLPIYGYTVQTGRIDMIILFASLPFGILAFLNLLATTWPDREADAIVGKRTLATRWFSNRLRLLYLTAAAGFFLLMIFFLRTAILPPLVAWSSFLVTPLVVWGALAYTRSRSPFPTVAAMVLLLILQTIAWWMSI